MKLPSPSHVVLGSGDLDETRRFLACFDFEPVAEAELTAEENRRLYGHEVPTRELVLQSPGSKNGWIRVVETACRYNEPEALDPRPLGIVVLTRNLERSLDLAEAAGGDCGDPIRHPLQRLREATVFGPHRLRLVLREPEDSDVRLRDADRLHSEVAGVMWAVRGLSTTLGPWQSESGLRREEGSQSLDPIVCELSRIDDLSILISRMTLGRSDLLGFELVDVHEEDSGRNRPTWPLGAGLHAMAFTVRHLKKAVDKLGSSAIGEAASLDTATHVRSRGVSCRGPGRIRYELWQESSPLGHDKLTVN